MAPRRIILVGANEARRKKFVGELLAALDWVKGIALAPRVQEDLRSLLEDAEAAGARAHGTVGGLQQPVLITEARPSMRIAQADIFAPILSLMGAGSVEEAVEVNEACPYALTAGIFGDEREALALAARLTAGTVAINDLMVPAADPRTPFGGRRSSGFGTTQGAEGLLEMTAPKTIAVRRGRSTRHFDATTATHEPLFDGVIKASHAGSWRQRLGGLREIFSAASRFGKRN